VHHSRNKTERKRIASVVLNYQTPELVIDCLRSLVRELDPVRDALVVVDNASGDDSVEKLGSSPEIRSFGPAQLLEMEVNGGFASGMNAGIRAIDAEAYLLVNSDALVDPGSLEALWQSLNSSSDVGLVAPRLRNGDGEPLKNCFRFHTPWSELIAGSATGPIRRILASWDVPMEEPGGQFYPEWVSFAVVLVRAEVMSEVGLLDDEFFMYYEDVDFCRRMAQRGWRVMYQPAATGVHLAGGSSQIHELRRLRERRPRYYYAARSRYFGKHFGVPGLVAANMLRTVGRSIAFVRERIGRKKPHTARHETLDIWRG
jgi:GT2 family glycosyltransferase